ncbi:MAG: LysE family translocator [Vicinamibacterales bacterium]
MFGSQHLELFILSGLLLNITPGQDTLYIIGRSLSQGRRAGLLSVLGISSGSVIHTLAAAFGLSAILATSAQAFVAVKLVGAAYLVYLGARLIVERSKPSEVAPAFAPEADWTVYRAGLLTNVLNPKVALFFMAFLPQFVAPTTDSQVLTFLFLGTVFIFNGTLWCLLLVWGASAASQRLRGNTTLALSMRRAAGVLFMGLGVRLAVTK